MARAPWWFSSSNGFVLLGMLLFAFVLLCSWTTPCSGLYEDQVGMWDWHQQYIGKVTHGVFQTQGTGRRRVVVATEKNVIASLNLRTGEIFWRQILEESEPTDGLEIALGKYAISLSRGGYLRAWHLPDGALVWETFLHSSSSQAQLLLLPVDLNNDRSNDLVILKGRVAYAVSSADGRVIWTADLRDGREEDVNLSGASLTYEDKKLYIAGFASSALVLFQMDAMNGAVNKKKINGPHGDFSTSGLIVTAGVAVGLDSQGLNIIAGDINDKEVLLEKTSLSVLVPPAVNKAHLLPTKIAGAFGILVDDTIHVVKVDKTASPKLRVVGKFQQPATLSNSLILDEGTSALAAVQHLSSNKVLVHILSTNDWSETVEEIIELEPHRGLVQKVFLNTYTRTDRTRGFRVLVVGEDDSLALLQQGKVVWTREDALASVIDATTAELPLEKAGVSVAEVEHSLAEWLKGHILRLKSTLMLATSDELATLHALRLNSAEKTKMVRDHNGFRKLIIALTSSGKLFALHTGDGRIVWSLLIPSLRSTRGMKLKSLKLYPWQIPHHHALDENPVVLVLGMSPGANGILSWVDMHTGKELMALELSYPVKQAISLPLTDSSERRLHLLIDDQEKAHLFPETDESLSLFRSHMHNIYYHTIDKETGLMEGFGIKSEIYVDSDKQLQGYTFSTRKLWSVVFPGDSEVIAATATRRPDEVVHTQAKVLGNRDVMYKYLNKNMVFVATLTPQDSNIIGAANPEETWLVAYLIDSVTGQVLHRVSHPNAQGPVHAVFSENWVVYYYFNVRSHRHEMSVLEVYDKSEDGKDVLQLMLGRYNASVPFSSFSHRNLEVKDQSYFFSSTVKTMTVTATAKGITGKQILVGTICNQVIALDKRFFDPRRSLSPTPAEREEGVLPLTDGLPVFPQSYISHSSRVEGLRGIVSVPARLESTCLVFAYGIDLFYTRTAPSRTYDSLTEDFSYALLLITIVVLVVAIAVSWVLSERKELREKWK